MSRALRPDASNHRLYSERTRSRAPAYPEGNFGGNQLLDGSISLSPLYPSRRTIVHVKTRCGLHRSFLRFALLWHSSPSFGPDSMLSPNPSHKIEACRRAPSRGIPPVSLPLRFTGDRPPTRTHVDSLVRASRRPSWGPAGRRPERAGAPRARCDGARCAPRSRRRRLHRHDYSSGLGRRLEPRRSTPESIGGPACRRSTSDRAHRPPHPLPPDNLKHSSTFFSKSFSSFLAVLASISASPVFSLGRTYRPIGAVFPNNPTPADSCWCDRSGHDGFFTFSAPLPGTRVRPCRGRFSSTHTLTAGRPRFCRALPARRRY